MKFRKFLSYVVERAAKTLDFAVFYDKNFVHFATFISKKFFRGNIFGKEVLQDGEGNREVVQ